MEQDKSEFERTEEASAKDAEKDTQVLMKDIFVYPLQKELVTLKVIAMECKMTVAAAEFVMRDGRACLDRFSLIGNDCGIPDELKAVINLGQPVISEDRQ
jgi:hypothetical protein